ncbi:Hsp20 family protein [Paraferrimonas sp. SM1919]|uniref:Hsp20 family protein n=1 Tax=Paraferrimonas sp. SM1919 TaxID=2662263 RepID=UPI0013D6066F|nr:Hsp20 family protein [Paraferrimonas sp. SM1919]
MNAITFSPFYRSRSSFDRFASLFDGNMTEDSYGEKLPQYNIQALTDDRYQITLAVAGFKEEQLSIEVSNGVLFVKGSKLDADDENYLHRGINHYGFERKFNLADHIEVTGADLSDGLLTIKLVKEVPEALKPKIIQINQNKNLLNHEK